MTILQTGSPNRFVKRRRHHLHITGLLSIILTLGIALHAQAQNSNETLDTRSHDKLRQSLDALSQTTTNAEYNAMIRSLNLMVVERSGGEIFRPSPKAVKEVGEIVHGMTPAQVIERAGELENRAELAWINKPLLLWVRPRDEDAIETLYSQYTLIGITEAPTSVTFAEDVPKDGTGKKLESNAKKASSQLLPMVRACESALGDARDRGEDRVADYPDLVSMNNVLDILLDRTRDMEAFIGYRDRFMSRFGKVRFTTRADQRVCDG